LNSSVVNLAVERPPENDESSCRFAHAQGAAQKTFSEKGFSDLKVLKSLAKQLQKFQTSSAPAMGQQSRFFISQWSIQRRTAGFTALPKPV